MLPGTRARLDALAGRLGKRPLTLAAELLQLMVALMEVREEEQRHAAERAGGQAA